MYKKATIAFLYATTAGASAVVAQPAGQAPPGAIEQINACRSIPTPNERLACFDRAAAALAAARENREIVVLNREEVRRTERELFGFPVRSLPGVPEASPAPGRPAEPARLNQVESTITAVRSAGYGIWAFDLQDGSTWRMLETDTSAEPERGDRIRIERAAFGSYRAFISGRRPIRVRRTD